MAGAEDETGEGDEAHQPVDSDLETHAGPTETSEVAEALEGARVSRVDMPHRSLIALSLRWPERREALVMSLDGAWGLVESRPIALPADGVTRILRRSLENARLVRVWRANDGARAELEFDGGARRPQLSIGGPAGVVLTAGDGQRLWQAPDGVGRGGALAGPTVAALRAAGVRLVDRVLGADERRRRTGLRKALARRAKQLRRRRAAIEVDRARADEVDGLRETAGLLLASAHEVPAAASVAEVTDWHADPPARVSIPLGEGRGPREEARWLYRRAGRFARGAEVAMERAQLTDGEIAKVVGLMERLADGAALESIEAEARAVGITLQRAKGGSAEPERRSPFREFTASTGHTVWVGRSARDNDTLTLRHARPHDLWMHARGVPGSHVVVRLARGETCPDAALLDAAHLAARFSDLRNEARVEVQYAERRYVRKPRGAAPGAVTLTREKTRLVRIDAARLERLLRG